MSGREFEKYIKDNQHRNLEAAEIKVENRLNGNNQEVSQILFYFWDEHGMGDYIVLSSKKIPVDHFINKMLVKQYQNIFNRVKQNLINQ